MADPNPIMKNNAPWRAAMKAVSFKPGRMNHIKCKAMLKSGRQCGQLAMVSYGFKVCGYHGGFSALSRLGIRLGRNKRWADDPSSSRINKKAARKLRYKIAKRRKAEITKDRDTIDTRNTESIQTLAARVAQKQNPAD